MGPLLAAALTPLSAGLIIATLALVAYDGLLTRIEKLAGSLDRLGAETIDAIALTAPVSSPAITLAPVPMQARTPRQSFTGGGMVRVNRSDDRPSGNRLPII